MPALHLFALLQHGHAGIHGVLAELFFDSEKLIVFRQTVAAAQGTGLDLAAIRGHHDVGDRRILVSNLSILCLVQKCLIEWNKGR